MRSVRGTFADFAPGIRTGCVCSLPDHLCGAGTDDREESGTRGAGEVRRTAVVEAGDSESHDRAQQNADAQQGAAKAEPHAAAPGASRVRRGVACAYHRWGFYGTGDDAVLLRSRRPSGERLRIDRGGHGADSERSETVARRHRGKAAPGSGVASVEPEPGRDWRDCGAEQDCDVALS